MSGWPCHMTKPPLWYYSIPRTSKVYSRGMKVCYRFANLFHQLNSCWGTKFYCCSRGCLEGEFQRLVIKSDVSPWLLLIGMIVIPLLQFLNWRKNGTWRPTGLSTYHCTTKNISNWKKLECHVNKIRTWRPTGLSTYHDTYHPRVDKIGKNWSAVWIKTLHGAQSVCRPITILPTWDEN